MDKIKKSSLTTQKIARQFTRRTAIKRGAAAAAFVGAAPMFVKNAFAASSGQVNVVMWGEYLPDSVVADFKAKVLEKVSKDEAEKAIKVVLKYIGENPNREGGDLLTALVLEGYTSLSTFKFEQGEAAVNKAILIGKQFSIDYLEAWALAVSGLLKIQKGELDDAIKLFIKGVKQNNKYAQKYSYMGSLNSVLLAEAYYEKNEIDKAK